MSGKVKVWGNVVTVEWADPIEDPDPEVMAKVSVCDKPTCQKGRADTRTSNELRVPPQVKVLFVRNLANGVTEEILEKSFSEFGTLERVKKLKDYAFIHFEERDGAVKVRAAAPWLWFPRQHADRRCLSSGAGGAEREGAGGGAHRDRLCQTA